MTKPFRFILIIILFSLLTACSGTSEPKIRPNSWAIKVPNSQIRALYKVDNHLYRSGLPTRAGMRQAEKMGIRYVLNLHHFGNDNAEIRGTSLQVKQIKIHVTKMTYDEIVQSLRYIVKADKPVLVHCLTGADRTGVVVAAYHMLKGWKKEDAIDEMLNGGYHFRRHLFSNLVPLVKSIDIQRLKQDVYSRS